MMDRLRLANRRRCLVFDYEVAGAPYRAQIGYFDNGQPGEIFLDGPKIGSGAQIAAHDAAVAASLALQFNCPLPTLKHALTKLRDGSSAGPLGRALDLIADGKPYA